MNSHASLERRANTPKRQAQKKDRKSTPHKRGVVRQDASGKSYKYTVRVPDHLKPMRNGVYRVRITILRTDKVVHTSFEIRSLENGV